MAASNSRVSSEAGASGGSTTAALRPRGGELGGVEVLGRLAGPTEGSVDRVGVWFVGMRRLEASASGGRLVVA